MPVDLLADKLDLVALGILLLFIVFPGMVIMRVFRLLAVTKEIDWNVPFYESSFWGVINVLVAYLIWEFVAFLISFFGWYVGAFIVFETADQLIVRFIFLVATASILPTIWLYCRKRQFIKQHLLRREPTAWDYYFSERKECFVLAHLKNGDLIAGYFGNASFVSASPDETSIYLETVYDVDENGQIGHRVQNSDGVLLRGCDFEYLELFQKPAIIPIKIDIQEDVNNEKTN